MKLIIGLGNPGKKYANTRHNIGKTIVSKLESDQNTKVATTDTYMNESGISVQKLVHFYKIDPSDLYLIHDDLDLPVGEYRIQFDRGPAGHHGVESVVQHLGTQAFNRIRIGIGHPPANIPVEDYVLKSFTPSEKMLISQTVDKILEEIKVIMGH
jgi:peptidyl-tRNA hydrolase, PTH1 family